MQRRRATSDERPNGRTNLCIMYDQWRMGADVDLEANRELRRGSQQTRGQRLLCDSCIDDGSIQSSAAAPDVVSSQV